MLITIIAFIAILSILVLIHELGHFLVAKKLGIKVEEFGFGFPPRVWGVKKGETIYSINLLPVGGFVKLYGEDDAGGGKLKVKSDKSNSNSSDGDIKRAFYARPLWQRITVVVAGVVMNFILAVVIISFLFASQGVPLPSKNIIVSEIAPNSPAARAGIQKGDKLIKFNDLSINKTDDFILETKKNLGKEVGLTILRDSKEVKVVLKPRLNAPKGQGAIGVSITNIEVKKYSVLEAPIYGTYEAMKFSWMILGGLGTMVRDAATGHIKPETVAGPIGVAQLTGEAVRAGWFAVLWFTALLSLNLAVLNIMPIPALDGGRFFFMLIELVFRRKVSPKYEAMAHGVGLVLLLGLMALITLVDVSRLLAGKSILP